MAHLSHTTVHSAPAALVVLLDLFLLELLLLGSYCRYFEFIFTWRYSN